VNIMGDAVSASPEQNVIFWGAARTIAAAGLLVQPPDDWLRIFSDAESEPCLSLVEIWSMAAKALCLNLNLLVH
jgi:hypothetical protein